MIGVVNPHGGIERTVKITMALFTAQEDVQGPMKHLEALRKKDIV